MHLAGGGIETGGEPVVLDRQAAPAFLAGVKAEEDRIVKFAVENADAAVVATTAELGEVLFPKQLAGIEIPRPNARAMVARVEWIRVRVNPAHHFLATVILGLAAKGEEFLRALVIILAGAGSVDGDVAVDHRRELPTPAGRAGKRLFPQQFACGRVETEDMALLHATMRHKQFAFHIQRRGEG